MWLFIAIELPLAIFHLVNYKVIIMPSVLDGVNIMKLALVHSIKIITHT